MTRRLFSAPAVVVAAAALALPSTAAASAFSLHVKFPNHTPVMNRKWPITVTATKGSRKLSGDVHYEFLLGSIVEAKRGGVSFSHGVAHDTLIFPGEAVGHPITLRVLVTTPLGTEHVDWKVTTKK